MEVACTSAASLCSSQRALMTSNCATGNSRNGALQCGSFNLPRIAYLAGGTMQKSNEMMASKDELLARSDEGEKKSSWKKSLQQECTNSLLNQRPARKDNSPYFDIENRATS